MAKNLDIYIDQGSDFTATFPPVTNTNGQVVDLTGGPGNRPYTVKCLIRRSYATIYAVQMTVDDSQFTNGIITVTLTNAETSGLALWPGLSVSTRWVYDVTVESPPPDSIVIKVFEGLATVNPGVSSKPTTTLLTPYIPDDYGGL